MAMGWLKFIISHRTMPRENHFYYDHLPNDLPKNTIHKLSHCTKITVSMLVAFVWFVVTHGKPTKINSLEGLSHIQTTMQYIFETTIAVQKKRFIKRIIEQSEGFWSYIPFANQAKWVDLEIQLTTRIGFNIRDSNVNARVDPSGKLTVDVYQPTVLDKQWKTKIVGKSDYFFAKWDIQKFQERTHNLLQDLAVQESLNLLNGFKSNATKMGQLAHRLEQRLEMKTSISYSPLEWINNLNRIIKCKVREYSDFIVLNTSSTPEILEHKPPSNDQNANQPSASRIVKNSKPERKATPASNPRRPTSKFKQIGYSEQQQQMRRQMKNQLNL